MKKILALILCLAMCVSLFAGFAVAEEKSQYDIVSIGDSTSIGYGLDDYGVSDTYPQGLPYMGDNHCGTGLFDFSSKLAFPTLIEAYVQEQLGDSYDVNAVNLGMEGMRFQELRAILDKEYEGDSFGVYHIVRYERMFSENGLGDIYEEYAKYISNAECIILDSATNSFGTPLAGRISGLGSSDITYTETFADVFEDLGYGTKEEITAKVNGILEAFGLSLDNELVKKVADAVLYCYADLFASFTKDIELIRNLNKTAKIIVVGPYNTMEGLSAILEGTEVDFGGLWASLMGIVDAYMTGNSLSDQYTYANLSGGIQMFWQSLAESESPEDVFEKFGSMIVNDTLNQAGMSIDIVNGAKAAVAQAGPEAVQAALAAYALYNAASEDFEGYTNADVCSALLELSEGDFAGAVGFIGNDNAAALARSSQLQTKYSVIGKNAQSSAALIEAATVANADNNILYTYMLAARYTDLDLMASMSALNSGFGQVGEFMKKCVMAGSYAEIDKLFADCIKTNPGIAGLLHINIQFQAGMGLGSHPDDVGCYQKYEAIAAAWNSSKTAKDDAASTAGQVVSQFGSTLFKTFKAPILDAIGNLFVKIIESFTSFFENIFGAFC